MACTPSWMAVNTISFTERLCPRWITSAPSCCRMRRMMLIEASCPSKSAVAVAKRILRARAPDSDRAVSGMGSSVGH